LPVAWAAAHRGGAPPRHPPSAR